MVQIVAAIADDPLKNAIRAVHEGADMIEIRIDLLNPNIQVGSLHSLHSLLEDLKDAIELPIIVTNRMRAEGGGFAGSEEERIKILLAAIEMTDLVDIELQTESEYRDAVVGRAKENGGSVIVSHHDFSETPDRAVMRRILSDCFNSGADIAKLAVTPHSYLDALHLLEVTLDCASKSKSVCTIGMGEYGVHTRVIAPLYGSTLAYVSVGAATAPGQLSIRELKRTLAVLSCD
ncbi:MAG TPA: type I 3-dehydroquinate dehydratase [Methanosarcinales archaeon]|nr:type I 3-dehydroquinate dehydratase [Methanosarcinales archaeon]